MMQFLLLLASEQKFADALKTTRKKKYRHANRVKFESASK
jgi:hypothetical protein